MPVLTKGNVDIEKIKVGDVHYEFEYGTFIKSKVITLPEKVEQGADEPHKDYWKWKAVKLDINDNTTDEIIDYGVTEGMAYYGPNLYDNMAYHGYKQI